MAKNLSPARAPINFIIFLEEELGTIYPLILGGGKLN